LLDNVGSTDQAGETILLLVRIPISAKH